MKYLVLTILLFLLQLSALPQQGHSQVTGKDNIIAIPASGESIDSYVAENFSRCPCFCFYNLTTDSITFRENKYKSASGGASRLVAQFLADKGVSKVYTIQLGQNARVNLGSFRIESTIVTSGKTVRQIIRSIQDK